MVDFQFDRRIRKSQKSKELLWSVMIDSMSSKTLTMMMKNSSNLISLVNWADVVENLKILNELIVNFYSLIDWTQSSMMEE